MSITRNLGGDRLGSGAKMNVTMHGFERSTHDMGYVWRSSMAPGTLVPFLREVALPGDTFDIEINADCMTHPTVGPLFSSFKMQYDVYLCPIGLYQAQLHNNKLGIGMEMEKIKIPQIVIYTNNVNTNSGTPLNQQQINQSALLAYLGIRGIGRSQNPQDMEVSRLFNAVPLLAYWDIYKNYYANKQEEIGMFLHTKQAETRIVEANADGTTFNNNETVNIVMDTGMQLVIRGEEFRARNIQATVKIGTDTTTNNILQYFSEDGSTGDYYKFLPKQDLMLVKLQVVIQQGVNDELTVQQFPLKNIDDMREDILAQVKNPNAYRINDKSPTPYGSILQRDQGSGWGVSRYSQEGLGIKTYQSDLFNNWLSTEWVDGDNGINKITSIDTSAGYFTLDTLNLSKKVYDMLNRIAVSGGSYDDWLDAVYAHDRYKRATTPMYMGGLSKELVFEEVVSTVEADENNPLGTLAGRGIMAKKHKGGKIVIKVDEPSYIIGICSITPRVDYSQGNEWDVNLQTMNDLHKPSLDGIGFQELITDQMAFWDTEVNDEGTIFFKSAGKQPAWINYMTNVNRTYGNFADERNEMFMTLNRRYEANNDGSIKDLTTYIDPSKFNYAFAQTELDAQNFWMQIAVDITARRKMSAKIIPNL